MSTVRIKEAALIKPSEKTPDEVLSLSTLDSQLFLRFSIEYLLVFLPGERSQHEVVSNMKLALADTLVAYYPLAGRVRAKADGLRLEVVCNAQGAMFIEAASNHYTAHDFSYAPRRVSQWRPFLSFHVADVLSGAPPVVLQLTWLRDGAAVLGVGLNHSLCDGIGSGYFLNSFADLARSKVGTAQFKPKPQWDRHLLDPEAHAVHPLCHPLQFSKINDVLGTLSTRFLKEKLVPTSATFDRKTLNELKKLAIVDDSSPMYTAYEVLSAQVWMSWAASLKLPQNQVLRLLFSVNIRSKLSPCLPAGYYGNAFILACAEATVKDLTERGISYVSKLIRDAKENADGASLHSLLEVLRERGESCPDLTGVLVISQWSRLGLEKMDFGMGTPTHVTSVCCDRYCLVLPVGNDHTSAHFRVMLALPATSVHLYLTLLHNPSAFISYY